MPHNITTFWLSLLRFDLVIHSILFDSAVWYIDFFPVIFLTPPSLCAIKFVSVPFCVCNCLISVCCCYDCCGSCGVEFEFAFALLRVQFHETHFHSIWFVVESLFHPNITIIGWIYAWIALCNETSLMSSSFSIFSSSASPLVEYSRYR